LLSGTASFLLLATATATTATAAERASFRHGGRGV
jgi:hypothetical protein